MNEEKDDITIDINFTTSKKEEKDILDNYKSSGGSMSLTVKRNNAVKNYFFQSKFDYKNTKFRYLICDDIYYVNAVDVARFFDSENGEKILNEKLGTYTKMPLEYIVNWIDSSIFNSLIFYDKNELYLTECGLEEFSVFFMDDKVHHFCHFFSVILYPLLNKFIVSKYKKKESREIGIQQNDLLNIEKEKSKQMEIDLKINEEKTKQKETEKTTKKNMYAGILKEVKEIQEKEALMSKKIDRIKEKEVEMNNELKRRDELISQQNNQLNKEKEKNKLLELELQFKKNTEKETTEKTIEKHVEKHIEKHIEKPIEKLIEKPVEKIIVKEEIKQNDNTELIKEMKEIKEQINKENKEIKEQLNKKNTEKVETNNNRELIKEIKEIKDNSNTQQNDLLNIEREKSKQLELQLKVNEEIAKQKNTEKIVVKKTDNTDLIKEMKEMKEQINRELNNQFKKVPTTVQQPTTIPVQQPTPIIINPAIQAPKPRPKGKHTKHHKPKGKRAKKK
jgi:hypothetical protein